MRWRDVLPKLLSKAGHVAFLFLCSVLAALHACRRIEFALCLRCIAALLPTNELHFRQFERYQ